MQVRLVRTAHASARPVSRRAGVLFRVARIHSAGQESRACWAAIRSADALKKSGVIAKGMIPKVDSAIEAVKAGGRKVAFIDGRYTLSRNPRAGHHNIGFRCAK